MPFGCHLVERLPAGALPQHDLERCVGHAARIALAGQRARRSTSAGAMHSTNSTAAACVERIDERVAVGPAAERRVDDRATAVRDRVARRSAELGVGRAADLV